MGILRFILTFIHVIISVLLVTVILLQASKGGGLSGTFGGQTSSTLFGPRGTATVLSSATQYLAVIFLALSLGLSLLAGGGGTVESVTQKVIQTTPADQLPPVEALDFGTGSEAIPSGDAAEEPFTGEEEGE